MDELAILIPCYNEELTIRDVILAFREIHGDSAAIYVYDNNSTDNTVAIARENGAIVRREPIQGKGNVIRRMFREIDAKCYILVDGDNTYSASSSKEMASLVLEGCYDMVIGDRLSSTYYTENKRPFHNFGNNLVRFFINKLFRSDIKDIMTGYRAFSYQFVKSFPVLSRGFEIETEMTIHAIDKCFALSNVIVDYKDRPEGSYSKLNTYSDGFRVLKTIGKLYRDYKPFEFFGVLSLAMMLACLCFFLPVFYDYVVTGLVPKFPTLIVCGFTALASIQLFFVGVILAVIKQKNMHDFEQTLHHVSDRYKDLTR